MEELNSSGRDSAVDLPREDVEDVRPQLKNTAETDDNTSLPTVSASAPYPLENLSLDENPEVDKDDNEDALTSRDSAYDSESLLGDDTMTLASFITECRVENGRRYHSYQDGSSWGPCDETANETQDLAHHMYLLTLDGKLHLAPIENPHRILDVGTGTGIWAIDMAEQYASAQVIGTDLSAIQPDFVPPNCQFEIDDVTLEWTYRDGLFGFIHVREMFGSIPDWDYFLEQCIRCVRPGGWVEIVEHSVEPTADDDAMPEDDFYRLWGKTVVEMGARFGKTFNIWKEAREKVEKAAFVEVTEVTYKWPMNGWREDPKLRELGRWNQLRLHEGIEGMMIEAFDCGWKLEHRKGSIVPCRDAEALKG